MTAVSPSTSTLRATTCSLIKGPQAALSTSGGGSPLWLPAAVVRQPISCKNQAISGARRTKQVSTHDHHSIPSRHITLRDRPCLRSLEEVLRPARSRLLGEAVSVMIVLA